MNENTAGSQQPHGDEYAWGLAPDPPPASWYGVSPSGASLPLGQPAPIGLRPCPSCAMPIDVSAIGCPGCGRVLASPRSKAKAILLAVFLSFWAWVYTYRKDRFKFWVGLVVATGGMLVPVRLLGTVMVTGVWIWAVADAVVRSRGWYRRYPG